MAKAKLTVYPYTTLDENGQPTGRVHADSYRTQKDVAIGGSISEYSGIILVHLPAIEIEVELPGDIQFRAAEVLRAHRNELRAAHQATLTKLQFLENQLLGLAAPDILDKGEGPIVSHILADDSDSDSDIPF